ncbi:MAG TPA: lipoprotein-releasing system transmembrane subunit LolC, partial [bacterium]
MRLSSYIGLRFLLSKRQDRSISVITWISGVGVMLGVTALIVTISVMNGFRANLFLAVTGATPHVRVLPKQGTWDADTQAAMMA